MKAILGYHYATGRWGVIDIMIGALSVPAETYERCQVDKLHFTKFVEAPIKGATIDDNGKVEVTLDDGYKLPKAFTLEDSIKKNKRILSGCLAIVSKEGTA